MTDLELGVAAFQERDYETAFRILAPIAEQGDPEAQCIMGCTYQLGLGKPQDYSLAFEWYLKSANQGYGVASNNLAGVLLRGFEGCPASVEEANKWFTKAREQGFTAAPLSADYLNRN